jgi:hypothetical protein
MKRSDTIFLTFNHLIEFLHVQERKWSKLCLQNIGVPPSEGKVALLQIHFHYVATLYNNLSHPIQVKRSPLLIR